MLRASWIVLALAVSFFFTGCGSPSVPAHTNAWLSYKFSRNCGSYSACQAMTDFAEPDKYYCGIGVDPASCQQYGSPNHQNLTLDQWKALYGFPTTSNPAAHAIYANKGDLQIGRDMNCVQSAQTIACYVTNYGPPPSDCVNVKSGSRFGGTVFECNWPDLTNAVTDAINGNNNGNPSAYLLSGMNPDAFATVAMVYTRNSGAANNANNVTFYVFAGTNNPNGQILLSQAALDSEGGKDVPQMCMACHGGTYDTTTHSATGATFLPFDVYYFAFSGMPGYGLDDQQEGFRNLNMLVAAANGMYAITSNGAVEKSGVVTITTAAPHSLVVGDSVNVLVVNGSGPIGGPAVVASVPSPNTFTYVDPSNSPDSSGGNGTVTLANQSASQIAINDFISRSYGDSFSVGGTGINFPNGLGIPGSIAFDGYVPQGWIVNGNHSQFLAAYNLYTNVNRQYCRMCHLAQTPTFFTYQEFQSYAGQISNMVCTLHDMPHAEVPFGGPSTSGNPNPNPFVPNGSVYSSIPNGDPHHFWLDGLALSDLKNFLSSQNAPTCM